MNQYVKIIAGLVVVALVVKFTIGTKKEGFAPYPGGLTAPLGTGIPSIASTAPLVPVAPGSLTTSADLLPKPVSGWNDNFRPQDLSNINFIDATKFHGHDTKGSTLKNANRDLRPSIPVPKLVSNFMNSDIEPDVMRRPLY